MRDGGSGSGEAYMWQANLMERLSKRNAEEEAAAKGACMPNDLQLMGSISSGLSCGQLYGASSEAAHLKLGVAVLVPALPSTTT
ncbi:hypothetical protein M9H77_36006 [Catharanthus roseus]|uniref:Uncharacterized protein n=1 Tax=Catharanthus roseus TaxID=4058 RepID=A0ACB9ZQK0_CATRO|nr:hypothetical protein M9H77_36006 [Catharanthus roseus]